jgi:hypothetical protein
MPHSQLLVGACMSLLVGVLFSFVHRALSPQLLLCTAVTCRVRQWTGDTLGWYANNSAPFLGSAGKAYVLIYGLLTLAFLGLMLCRGASFHLWTLGSSQRLHSSMVHK